MSTFHRNIKPAFEREIIAATQAVGAAAIFRHLERAHVLGQSSTRLHVTAHLRMAMWAIREHDPREFLGQSFRIVGAATKTLFGWVPAGNTGGARISPFKSLPIAGDLRAEIDAARQRL